MFIIKTLVFNINVSRTKWNLLMRDRGVALNYITFTLIYTVLK